MMLVRDQMHNDADGLYCLYAHTLNPPKFTSTPFLKLHTKTLVVSPSDDLSLIICMCICFAHLGTRQAWIFFERFQ